MYPKNLPETSIICVNLSEKENGNPTEVIFYIAFIITLMPIVHFF